MATAQRKKVVTLYFTPGAQLDEADVAQIDELKGDVYHRNAEFVGEDDKCEDCKYVAGPAVPAQYLEKYERAEGDTSHKRGGTVTETDAGDDEPEAPAAKGKKAEAAKGGGTPWSPK
jgi:hypothetical protein